MVNFNRTPQRSNNQSKPLATGPRRLTQRHPPKVVSSHLKEICERTTRPLGGNLRRYVHFSPVLAFWGGMCCTTFVPPNMMCRRESVCMSKTCSGLRSSTGSCRTMFRSQIHSYQQVNVRCSFLFLSHKRLLWEFHFSQRWPELNLDLNTPFSS